MKTPLLTLALLVLPATMVHAEQGDWVVRMRATHVSPNEHSTLGKTVNKNVANVMSPDAELELDSNTLPELDISYYWTKHIATELILALGSKHGVHIVKDSGTTVGNQYLGSIDALPPTLTAQWHFNPDQTLDPYVGAGLNTTFMLDRHLSIRKNALAGSKIKIDHESIGPALQAGLDIHLSDGWLLNADIKYLWIDTEVKLNTASGWKKIDTLDVNPWVISIGLGKRF